MNKHLNFFWNSHIRGSTHGNRGSGPPRPRFDLRLFRVFVPLGHCAIIVFSCVLAHANKFLNRGRSSVVTMPKVSAPVDGLIAVPRWAREGSSLALVRGKITGKKKVKQTRRKKIWKKWSSMSSVFERLPSAPSTATWWTHHGLLPWGNTAGFFISCAVGRVTVWRLHISQLLP